MMKGTKIIYSFYYYIFIVGDTISIKTNIRGCQNGGQYNMFTITQTTRVILFLLLFIVNLIAFLG